MAEITEIQREESATDILINQAIGLATEFQDGNDPETSNYLANSFHRAEVSVHFKWKASPGHLISAARPNEQKNIKDYRLLNSEQTTFAVGTSVMNSIRGTLSNPQVYSVKYADSPPVEISQENREDFQTYVEDCAAVPGKNLIEYFWKFIANQAVLDPNGYVVVINSKSDDEVRFISELTQDPVALSEWRKPKPFFLSSSSIMREAGDFVFARATEEVTIKITGTKGKDEFKNVPVFWYFTEDVTFRIEAESGRMVKTRDSEELVIEWSVIVWDHHNSGICARKPGGIISDERVYIDPKTGQIRTKTATLELDDVGFFLSVLSLALPDFNNAVKTLSDLQSGIVTSLYPIRTVELQKCGHCKGSGEIDHPNDPDEVINCTTCGGRGQVIPTSSFSSIGKKANEQGEIKPGIVWSAPPTEGFDMAWRLYQEFILSGLKAIAHGSLREASGNANDTARAKEIDQAEKHTIIRDIGNILYPLLQWVLDKSNTLRYGSLLDFEKQEQNRAVVIEPATLDITMLGDIFKQLEMMINTFQPPAIRKIWSKRAIMREIGTSSPSALFANAVLNIDPYANMSPDEILEVESQALGASDNARIELKTSEFIHSHAEMLVDNLIAELTQRAPPQDFLNLPKRGQVQEARLMASEIVKKEFAEAGNIESDGDDSGDVTNDQGDDPTNIPNDPTTQSDDDE